MSNSFVAMALEFRCNETDDLIVEPQRISYNYIKENILYR